MADIKALVKQKLTQNGFQLDNILERDLENVILNKQKTEKNVNMLLKTPTLKIDNETDFRKSVTLKLEHTLKISKGLSKWLKQNENNLVKIN